MNKEKIYLIGGAKGVGKSAVSKEVCEENNLFRVETENMCLNI